MAVLDSEMGTGVSVLVPTGRIDHAKVRLGESYGETTGLVTRVVDQRSRHQLSSMREDTREHVINR
jgi:hypothetical protein